MTGKNNDALEAFKRVMDDHNHGIVGNRTVEDYEADVRRVETALQTQSEKAEQIAALEGDGRLIAFEFNVLQTYLLVLTDEQIDIYVGGIKEETIASPWSEEQISQIVWTQSADTLLLAHPDVPPKRLTRSSGGVWALSDWKILSQNGEMIVGAVDGHEPFYSEPSASDLALMAAAPELLEALEAFYKEAEAGNLKAIGQLSGKRFSNIYRGAFAAIAKARGQHERIASHFDMDSYHKDAWKELALEMAEVSQKTLTAHKQGDK